MSGWKYQRMRPLAPSWLPSSPLLLIFAGQMALWGAAALAVLGGVVLEGSLPMAAAVVFGAIGLAFLGIAVSSLPLLAAQEVFRRHLTLEINAHRLHLGGRALPRETVGGARREGRHLVIQSNDHVVHLDARAEHAGSLDALAREITEWAETGPEPTPMPASLGALRRRAKIRTRLSPETPP